MKNRLRIIIGLVAFSLTMTNFTVAQAPAQTVTVDWNQVYQRIDGFGGSSAFTGFTWTPAQADMFFSTNNGTGTTQNGTNFPFTGIGLSLLRTEIQPAPDTNSVAFGHPNEIALAQMAQVRGARIWGTPWSPPAAFKDSGTINGGDFISANNQAYAGQLAGYVADLKHIYGINLYALSIQNEPDYNTSRYQSCIWNAQQFHDFVPYLYDALVASNVADTKIMLPEESFWGLNLASVAMNDENTSNQVSILAAHDYNFGDGPLNHYDKPLWETEVSDLYGAFDGSMEDGLSWAMRINSMLNIAQVNAWHYWWLISLARDNEGLTDNNWVPAKRMYVLGQWSRFVRPGYYRMGVTPSNPFRISAFQDTNSGSFAIVAIALNNLTVILTNFPAAVRSVTPWITSDTISLSNLAPIAVTNASFSYTFPNPRSLVTFVGQVNQPPVSRIGGPYAVECKGSETTVQLDGSASSDPDGDAITFNWSCDCPNATFSDPTSPKPILTIGATAVQSCALTLVVSDGELTNASQTTVTVVDTQPPEFSQISANPSILWPPNHNMIPVTVTAQVTDTCDPAPVYRIISMVSSDAAVGHGIAQRPDFQITGANTVLLRAERPNAWAPRTYWVVLQAEDASGNTATNTVPVIVPGAHN